MADVKENDIRKVTLPAPIGPWLDKFNFRIKRPCTCKSIYWGYTAKTNLEI